MDDVTTTTDQLIEKKFLQLTDKKKPKCLIVSNLLIHTCITALCLREGIDIQFVEDNSSIVALYS